jgi:hypothetical protein
MKLKIKNCLLAAIFTFSHIVMYAQDDTKIVQINNNVTISNSCLSLAFDLDKGFYSITDLKSGILVLEKARLSADNWNTSQVFGSTKIKGQKIRWEQKEVKQNDKSGKRLELVYSGSGKLIPAYYFSFTLLDQDSYIIMQAGIKNTLPNLCRFMNAEPIANASFYPGSTISALQTLNGAAGVTMPEVSGDVSRESTNSLMITALVNNKRHTVVIGGLKYQNYYATAFYRIDEKGKRNITLAMSDPAGRRIEKDEEWWAPDTYYLGVGTDPFTTLEQYGLAMRIANNANPNLYSFPTLCGWAVGNLSKGKDINNSKALVEEMDEANKCGLTKYTKVAVRLEPDFYCYTDGNTQQGWWDDEHWSKYGHLVAPYETFEKWCTGVKERDGIPFTYFQAGMPSDDFARAHPEWMLNDDISQLHLYHRHHQPYVRYDYTNAEFQKYTLSMWQRLRKEGLVGVKFDYPETAWNTAKFDDPLATTTSAYRKVFELCREGLGPDARIHERALGESDRPILDVTAGIVDIQRTAWDNNSFEPQYVTTGGLRWYKAGSVFRYYPDSKAIHTHSPETRQSLLTMMAFTSGRLELATPFKMLTPEMVHDISRIYPVYDGINSPRPVDAFTGKKDPSVYDLALTKDWHQVVLFNAGNEKSSISVGLSSPLIEGGLALEKDAEYYVYDFWKDTFIGKFNGTQIITANLDSMACALYSIRKVLSTPQLLSTNRHILQGWMDIKELKWDENKKALSGKACVVAGEPFKIVIANNNREFLSVIAPGFTITKQNHPSGNNTLDVIVIESRENNEVPFTITYKN